MQPKKPVRILHVFGVMNRGGAETLVMNIYRHIDRSKVQFDFVVHTKSVGHYDEEIANLGGRIINLTTPSEVGFVRYSKELKKNIMDYGPYKGVHSHIHHFSGSVLGVAKKLNIPVRISHSHNTQDAQEDSLKRNIYRHIMSKLIKMNATHLFGCSRDACESLFGKKCWSDSRVTVVQNALSMEPFMEHDMDRLSLRKELNISLDVPLIGHVGRFSKQKNHELLIEIFNSLKKKIPTVHMVLVGDGELRNEIEELIESKGLTSSVHLLGIREDIPLIMSNIDLFLFPSLFEGLGNVLIEAQAAGTPCVCSSNIPKEVDLNIGLVEFANLTDDIDIWISKIIDSLSLSRPSSIEIYQAITDLGYDIRQLAKKLEKVYG